MKEPEFNPSFPTIPVLIVMISLGAGMLALGLFHISIVYEGLRTGRIYSFSIIYNIKHYIYRTESPEMYWGVIGFYIFCLFSTIGLGATMLMGFIVAYIKRLLREKKEREEWNTSE